MAFKLRHILLTLGLSSCAPEMDTALKDCADCPEMVVLPSGSFTMGRDGGEEGRYEGPPHAVTIETPFAMAKTEVTQADFARFMAASNHEIAKGCNVWPTGTMAFEDADWQTPGYTPEGQHPVACVSWGDAQAYIAWLSAQSGVSYRLPSEAEWEYAAGAGAATNYPWGDAVEDGCTLANWYDASAAGTFRWANSSCDDGHKGVAPVASYPANAFGLHDMIGNVWEWTQDCYEVPYPANAVTQLAIEPPAGDTCDRRSVRGGSWMTRPDRNRIHFRGRDPEDTRYFMFGFRIARDLSPEELARVAAS